MSETTLIVQLSHSNIKICHSYVAQRVTHRNICKKLSAIFVQKKFICKQ